MCRIRRFLVLAVFLFNRSHGGTFTIRIATENHVNVVDSRFVSFTIDPKYLFTSSDDLTSQESTCMAAALTPAYLRIAGPSTSHITFNNISFILDRLEPNLPEPNKQKRHLISDKDRKPNAYDSEESHEDILSKLKKSSDKLLKRHKRDLESVSEEITKNVDENEDDNILTKLKKSRIHSLQKLKRNLKLDDGDKILKSHDSDSYESILSKLNKPTITFTKQKKNPVLEKNNEELSSLNENSHENILSKLKKPKFTSIKPKKNLEFEDSNEELTSLDENSHKSILQKLRKPKITLEKQKKSSELVDNNEEQSLSDNTHENVLSKLKKPKIALTKQKKDQELDDNNEEPSLADDSHESILSKLKKPKRNGLFSKLIKSNQEKESDERPKRLRRLSKDKDHLEVSHRQWKRFSKWAKDTGFSLVFAVNNGEKTENGMWDPNPALNMLTIADKDGVQDIFWQLGYECNNQTLEDYLNDLQTLRMMVDTFESRRWKVVGGDVSGCLEAGSKSDFKDYVTLSTDTMDAVLLNGNSSSHELARMSDDSRLSLLRVLSTSSTPLWLTENPQRHSEQARAADWLTSLGYSARNGFHVHYRELLENELHEPTLSFYMALLFKNLVGERVLDVTMEPSDGQAALFAHCTSLRHKPVPGAVTLYGVNMDSEPARFSVKLAKREEGGDIMQFILGHDHNGNIVVNGRPMFYEGNIRPVVKRVRPYKTLLLNLPPKSFGFWVLANTKVDACYDYDDKNITTLVEAKPVNITKSESKEEINSEKKQKSMEKTDISEEITKIKHKDEDTEENNRRKRSVHLDDFALDTDMSELNKIDNDEALKSRIESMNRGLRDVQGLFENGNTLTGRVKRQTFEEEWENKKKSRKQLLKKGERNSKNEHTLLASGIFEKLLKNVNSIKIPKLNLTKTLRDLKQRKSTKSNISKISKRNSRNFRNREDLNEADEDELSRKKRSLLGNKKKLEEDKTAENEIDLDDKKHFKLGNFLKKNRIMQNFINDDYENTIEEENEEQKSSKNHDGIEINTKITNDDAEIKISENADHGLLNTAFENVLSLLEELNHNLGKLWTALSFLE